MTSLSNEPMSFQRLLKAAQKGNKSAVDQIILQYSHIIQRECAKYGLWQHPDWSHSDLVQEVLFRVWDKIQSFRGADTANPQVVFEHWIRKTARTVLSNLQRKRSAKKRKPENGVGVFDEANQQYQNHVEGEKTPSSIMVRNESVEQLQEAISACLNDEAKTILELRMTEGLSLTEIAERLEMTYDMIRNRYKTSLRLLEKWLKERS